MQLSEILSGNEYSTINLLFKKANIDKNILNNVTIFLPFNKSIENIKDYLSLLNTDEAKFIILSHVIPKKTVIERLVGNYPTIIGNIINITFENNKFYVDGKPVILKNYEFNGGYLNIIDGIGFDPRLEKKEINVDLAKKDILTNLDVINVDKNQMITEGNPLIGDKKFIKEDKPKIKKEIVLSGILITLIGLFAIIIYQKKSKRNV
jgi:hypothetical protein